MGKVLEDPITERVLKVVEVVIKNSLHRVSNTTNHRSVASGNITDLNDRRRILGKERRFDEAVLVQQCRRSERSSQHTWYGL